MSNFWGALQKGSLSFFYCLSVKNCKEKSLPSSCVTSTIQNFKLLNERLLFFMVEQSRKASLHAATTALHSNQKFFFTSSRNPGSLACKAVSFRLRSISLMKPHILFAGEVFTLSRVMIVLFYFLQEMTAARSFANRHF